MSVFHLTVSTSAGRVFDGEAERIVMRGANGDFAILADHAPFMTLVKPCECVIIKEGGEELRCNSGGGVFQVADNKASFLSGEFSIEESIEK